MISQEIQELLFYLAEKETSVIDDINLLTTNAKDIQYDIIVKAIIKKNTIRELINDIKLKFDKEKG